MCAFSLLGALPAGIDLDEARRKREDNIVQLRKDRRDESLQKKRMVTGAEIDVSGAEMESTQNPSYGVQQKVSARLPRRRGEGDCRVWAFSQCRIF